MAADGTATQLTPPPSPVASVPGQSRRRVPLPPADRIVRQVAAIDAWVDARRERERALHAPRRSNADERMDVARELAVLRRTHDAIKGRCARELAAEASPMRLPTLTAVVAHRHSWFMDKLALLLDGHGVTVLVGTDNGAEALGAVVAEQPDVVLVGDRLAMMTGAALLAESRVYAPSALLVGHASDREQADVLRAAADTVFLRHHSPDAVADALDALLLTTTDVSRRA